MTIAAPVGVFPAKASGYVTSFTHEGVQYICHCQRGVRGVNITDTVTLTKDEAKSSTLGPIKQISIIVANYDDNGNKRPN